MRAARCMSLLAEPSVEVEVLKTWRHRVLEVALRVSSVVMPLLFVAIFASRHGVMDPFIAVLGVLVCVMVALRYWTQLMFEVREGLLIARLQVASIDAVVS